MSVARPSVTQELWARTDARPDAGLVNEPRWAVVKCGDDQDVAHFAQRARRELKLSEFQHDPEWQYWSCHGGVAEAVMIAGESNGTLTGLLLARSAPTSLTYDIRGTVLLRRRVRQYTMHQGPVNNGETGGIERAFAALDADMDRDAVVYLSSVPVGSPLHGLLTDRRSRLHRRFHIVRRGGPTEHCKILWPGSVARYLDSLSTKRRANVRRAVRKVSNGVPFEVRKFHRPQDVDAFVRDAGVVAAKSHGHTVLADAANPARADLIRFASTTGAFLGYVLYAGETPIAYRYGFVYARTLFCISTGFDPTWSDRTPGAVIFFRMMEDLEGSRVPLDMIDFLPHETAFKRERANLVEAMQSFYLFKRSWLGFSIYAQVRLLDEASRLAARLADRYSKRLPSFPFGT